MYQSDCTHFTPGFTPRVSSLLSPYPDLPCGIAGLIHLVGGGEGGGGKGGGGEGGRGGREKGGGRGGGDSGKMQCNLALCNTQLLSWLKTSH